MDGNPLGEILAGGGGNGKRKLSRQNPAPKSGYTSAERSCEGTWRWEGRRGEGGRRREVDAVLAPPGGLPPPDSSFSLSMGHPRPVPHTLGVLAGVPPALVSWRPLHPLRVLAPLPQPRCPRGAPPPTCAWTPVISVRAHAQIVTCEKSDTHTDTPGMRGLVGDLARREISVLSSGRR